MADYIDIVRGVTTGNTTKGVSGDRMATTETNRAVQSKGAAEFSTTSSYREFQSRLLGLLEEHGFNQAQATQLSEIGNLKLEQLLRVIVLAQVLQQNKEMFQRLADTVKNIISLGKNVQIGLKSYLDGMERVLGMNTMKLLQQIKTQKPAVSVPQNTPVAGAEKAAQGDFEMNLYREINQQIGQANLNKTTHNIEQDLAAMLKLVNEARVNSSVQLTTSNLNALREFNDLADASLKEFPTRYHIDLYSFTQLNQKEVPLNTYIKLASEISPTRLINLLIVAEKTGHGSQAIIDALMNTQSSGGSVKDAVLNMEYRFGINLNFLQQTGIPDNFIPVTAKEVTMKEGDDIFIHFLALDSGEGVIPAERSGFVVFPQKYEYSGYVLNLAHLPAGVYMVMAMGYDKDNAMIQYWMKVIVEERIKKMAQKTFDEFKKKIDRDKEQAGQQKQSSDFAQGKQQEDEQPPEGFVPSQEREGVTTDFEKHPANFRGPFLGEVVLPFDYLNQQADDLVIMSPETGFVVDQEELCDGCFPSNTVTFRFLTNYIENVDTVNRHALFHLKQSRTFSLFNEGVKKFVNDPQNELPAWKKTLHDFFDILKSAFPAGQTSFDVAHKFFVQESENFANGEVQGEIFENRSLERKEDRFLAALYSKGSYALACAGEVAGALHGMGYVSLMDLGDRNSQSILGEYLEDLKRRYFSREMDSRMQNLYEVHLSHNFKQKLTGNSFYQPIGESFIRAVDLKMIPVSAGPKRTGNPAFGYGAYSHVAGEKKEE